MPGMPTTTLLQHIGSYYHFFGMQLDWLIRRTAAVNACLYFYRAENKAALATYPMVACFFLDQIKKKDFSTLLINEAILIQ